MKIYKILALNMGSTSTKIAYFENECCVIRNTLDHAPAKLAEFGCFWDQEEYRKEAVEEFLREHAISPDTLDAVAAWGGHTEPVEDGVYRITPKLLEQSRSEQYGNHPGDLAPRLAYELAGKSGKAQAFTIDPPTIDEFGPLARYSGLPEIQRRSRMQSLNQKATARRYARDIGRQYEDLNLIVVHMGGGTSVVVHEQGKMTDANNGLDGDGPFATNRSGSLPVGDLIDLCYSGRYTHAQMRRKITGEGGFVAYLGENDMRQIEAGALAGNEQYAEVLDAMIYQTAKEIGAAATVLGGKVDAILLAGGIAHSDYITAKLQKRTEFIAPLHVYAGELEMESLGLMSLEALCGSRPVKQL